VEIRGDDALSIKLRVAEQAKRIAELEAENAAARQHIEWLIRYVKHDSSDAAGVVLNAQEFLVKKAQ
jgi:hypothetical protein